MKKTPVRLPRNDISGQVFGKISVIKYSYRDKNGNSFYDCRCVCGEALVCLGGNLLHKGRPIECKSCRPASASRQMAGENNPHYRHGQSRTLLYKLWATMIRRCTSEKANGYKRYGGRGISVCDRWRDFVNFRDDMGKRPVGFQIDRIDNDGNYEPGNCRWVTVKENNHFNRSTIKDDKLGRIFNQWTVLKRVKPKTRFRHRYYMCRCRCGFEAIKAAADLNGLSKNNPKPRRCRHIEKKDL